MLSGEKLSEVQKVLDRFTELEEACGALAEAEEPSTQMTATEQSPRWKPLLEITRELGRMRETVDSLWS